MKRRTLLALAASTVLLAACGQSPTNDAETKATDTAASGGSDLLQRITAALSTSVPKALILHSLTMMRVAN